MWFCFTCFLCITVAARAHPQNVVTANITHPREIRYGNYYHPPEYTFSTPPPPTISSYYSNQYPLPGNKRQLPPYYGNQNLPSPPHSNQKPYIPQLPNSNQYPPPGNPLPPYGKLIPTLPHYNDSNSYILPTLPYSNEYPPPGDGSPLRPYGNLSPTAPHFGISNSYTPPRLPYSNEYPPPGDGSPLRPYGNLSPTAPHFDISNSYTPPRLPYSNEYPPPGDGSPLLPNGNLNQTLQNDGVSNYTWPTFNSDRTSLFDSDEEDFCNPHFPEKPDFLVDGRRISEAKCMDNEWNLKRMQEVEQKRIRCEAETKRKKTGYYEAVPAAVGGRAAFPGEFPHMGAVGWLGLNGEWLFKCGGSLISAKFVLTAAHCSKASGLSTDLADPIPKIVRLSHVNIDLATRYEMPLKYDVNIERIIVHPNYKPPKKYYDIALMELDHEVGFSQMVQPACLWTSPDIRQLSAIATLTGWGVLKEGSRDISPILQAAVVDFIGKRRCDTLLAKKHNRHWSGLQEHQICAGKLAGGVDACQGDSGGPLQVRKKLDMISPYKMYYVVGVTAFGFGCARRNLPGVYTRVSSFLDWIEPIVWP